MPRGYRGLIAASGLGALFCAFGIGLYISALTHSHYEHQCGRAANRAAYSKQRCPQQVDTDRAGLPYLAQSIASNPEPRNEDEREKRDLFAQESAALWGFWSLIVAAISVAITAIGTGFLLWQIILTRRAVEDTGHATDAMKQQNLLSMDAVRPWLRITPPTQAIMHRVYRNDGSSYWGSAAVEVKVKNFGQSPAIFPKVDMILVDSSQEHWKEYIRSNFFKSMAKQGFPGPPIYPQDGYDMSQRQIFTPSNNHPPVGRFGMVMTIGVLYRQSGRDTSFYTRTYYTVSYVGDDWDDPSVHKINVILNPMQWLTEAT